MKPVSFIRLPVIAMQNPNIKCNDTNEFVNRYIRLRKLEGRLYSDEEVSMLPDISEEHIHKAEWRIRKESCRRLIKYLAKKKKRFSILEIGCGNGWLSNQMASIKNAQVTGIDINVMELNQAKRVFVKPNLTFLQKNIDDLRELRFDIIVFASSIQYFSQIQKTIKNCFRIMKDKGEIHIIDTHFYSTKDIGQAKIRSHTYFQNIGQEVMDSFYFHHSLDDLKGLRVQTFNRYYLWTKFSRISIPFPWLCITR